MDRRSLLQSLVSLGIGWQITPSIALASQVNVDAVWQAQLEHPTVFCVDGGGTIWLPGIAEVEYRYQAFPVRVSSAMTEVDLRQEINRCDALTAHINSVVELELDELECSGISQTDSRLIRLKQLVDAQPQGEDWRAWLAVREEGCQRDEVVSTINEWLAGYLDEPDLPYICRASGPQGEAVQFFEALSRSDLNSLGVVIVEGDQPGSSYVAAELRRDLHEANAQAIKLGWPIVFRSSSR